MPGFHKIQYLLLPCVAGAQARDFCSYEFGWKEVAGSGEMATALC